VFKARERLQWKDVRFLTKKRQVFSQWLLTIFYVEQYPNRKFHQFSFHVPILVSKRAVVRHKVKRLLINSLEKQLPSLDFWWKYYKCYITLRKMKLQQLLEILAKKDSNLLISYLENENTKAFTSFCQFLWKRH
jgi:RNase P protein component